MGVIQKKIAVLCNYELLSERVGGMDYFFWDFDAKCKENNIAVDWFFPNNATHGNYNKLKIISTNEIEVELYFANYLENNETSYSSVFTHFVELCTPVFKKIKEKSNAKIIAVDHNPRPLKGYPLLKRIKKRVKGFLYVDSIDVFVGVSNYSKNQLGKEFGSRVSKKAIAISNGLQFEKFKTKTNYTFQNKFIIASHLRKDKGIQDVIKAVSNLTKNTNYNFVIAIYGSGYYENFLKNLVVTLQVGNFFEFKGSVSNLNEIYCNYDYLIHPSHGETFCYSVVEALICNLPVITTKNQGNVLGLVHDNYNGFLFEEGNVATLKNILELILLTEHQINASTNYNPELKQLTLTKMVENYYKLLS